MTFQLDLIVTPRTGVRDPQAEAVGEALRGAGFAGVQAHTVGRTLRLSLDADTETAARAQVDTLCAALLVNPSLETYVIRRVLADDPAALAPPPPEAP